MSCDEDSVSSYDEDEDCLECNSCMSCTEEEPSTVEKKPIHFERHTEECKECVETKNEHNIIGEVERILQPKNSAIRAGPQVKKSYSQACCEATSRDAKVQDWISNRFKDIGMFDDRPVWHCHWGHGHDEEVAFNTLIELDSHLKNHIEGTSDQNSDQAVCHWDSCDASLDVAGDVFNHIKTVHYPSSTIPHQSCVTSVSPLPTIESADAAFITPPDEPTPSVSAGPSDELFRCGYDSCDFNTVSSDLYWNHLHDIHNDAEQKLAIRVKSPPSISPFQCEWESCGFSSNDYKELSTHMRTGHNAPVTPDDDDIDAKEDMVDFEDEKEAGKERHICMWETEEGHELCNEEFKSASDLANHINQCHIGVRKKEHFCCWHGCKRGKKPFAHRQKIIRHMQTHTKNKPYVCDTCGRSFGEQSVLKQHQRIHSGEKPYACKFCGKKFAACTALSVHLRTHTGEKPLVCKFPGCGKRFSESSNLNKHMKTHLEGKPYACKCCNKRFSNQARLQAHLKMHMKQIEAMEKTMVQ